MGKKTLQMIGGLLAMQISSWGIAYGANSFWYQDAAPMTNRVAASQAAAVSGTATECRWLSVEWSDERTFTTYPRGLMFVVR